MISKKYSQLLFILIMSFGMSLVMTSVITAINTGIDNGYIQRFFAAWRFSFPAAILAASIVAPLAKKAVEKLTG